MKTVKFLNRDYQLVKTTYQGNENTSLLLLDDEGEWGAMATVNFGEQLQHNMAYIKDYSENTGMLQSLKDAGVVIDIVGSRASGFVVMPLVVLDLTDVEEMED